MSTPGALPSISVVVPVFNEQDNVSPLMERLFAVLDTLDNSSEVIAVDDGSRDETVERPPNAIRISGW